jgi:hypothetical protein
MQNLKRTWLSCSVAMLLAGLGWADARAADVFQQMGMGYGPGYAATNTSFSSFGGFRGNAGCGCGNNGANATLSPGCCEYPAGCCGNAWAGYCQERRCLGLGRGLFSSRGCGQSGCGTGCGAACASPCSSGCGAGPCTNCAPWPTAPMTSCGSRPFGGFFNKCCQSIFGSSSDCGCNSTSGAIPGADGAIYDSGPSEAQPQPALPPTPAPESPIKSTRSRST